MKICRKCNSENKDTSVFCTNCHASIMNVEISNENNYKKKSYGKVNKKSIVAITLLLLFMIGYMIWAMFICMRAFGELSVVLKQFILFIPCILFIVFPFDMFYHKYQIKEKNKDKHLNDLSVILLKSIGIVGMLAVYVRIFDVLDVAKL